jgi:hypothetical protein
MDTATMKVRRAVFHFSGSGRPVATTKATLDITKQTQTQHNQI